MKSAVVIITAGRSHQVSSRKRASERESAREIKRQREQLREPAGSVSSLPGTGFNANPLSPEPNPLMRPHHHRRYCPRAQNEPKHCSKSARLMVAHHDQVLIPYNRTREWNNAQWANPLSCTPNTHTHTHTKAVQILSKQTAT